MQEVHQKLRALDGQKLAPRIEPVHPEQRWHDRHAAWSMFILGALAGGGALALVFLVRL